MHSPPKLKQKPPRTTFSMVHLLHRLYGVDARGLRHCLQFGLRLGLPLS